jgi:hypothetical protein
VPRRTKADWERVHAQQRARERYGVTLTGPDLAALVRQIQTGTAVYQGRRSIRASYWRVTLPDGRVVPVVYDCRRHHIITFLTDAEEGLTPDGPT